MTIPPFVTSKTGYEKIEQNHASDSSTKYGEVWTRVRETQGDLVNKAVGFADLKTANGHATRKIDWTGVDENAEHHLKLKVQLTDKNQKLTLTSNGKEQVFLLPKKSDVDGLNTDGTIELEFREIKSADGSSVWEIKSSPKKDSGKKRSAESAANNKSFMHAYNKLNNPTPDKAVKEKNNEDINVNDAPPRDVEIKDKELLAIPGGNKEHNANNAFDGNFNIPKNIKKFASNWKASKEVFDNAETNIDDDKKHLGLNADATNACYIHTGIQLLRMMLPDAKPLAANDIEKTINNLISKNAKEIGVNDKQFIELLQLSQDDRLAELRKIKGKTENDVKNDVTEAMGEEIFDLQLMLGSDCERMSDQEKIFIVDQMETIAGYEIEGYENLINLYMHENPINMETAIRNILDSKPNYKSKDESNALNILRDFNDTLNKLHYLDAVLTVKDGKQAQSNLLDHIANEVDLTNVSATTGEQADAGEFAARIIQWRNELLPSNDKEYDFKKIEKRTNTEADGSGSQKIDNYLILHSSPDNIQEHDTARTIFAASQLANSEEDKDLTFQRIINEHLKPYEFNPKNHGEDQNDVKRSFGVKGFEQPEKPALSKYYGFSTIPELFSVRVDRTGIDGKNDRKFNLDKLDNIELELPIFDANNTKNPFKKETINYAITGFSVHSGDADKGHWLTYRLIDNKWYKFDNSSVSEPKEVDALEEAKNASSLILKHMPHQQ